MADRKTTFAFRAGSICLEIGLPLLCPGIYVAVSERNDFTRLKQAGRVVEGTLLAKVGSGRTYVKISYRFTTRTGQEITGKANIRDEAWLRLQENRLLRVTYIADDPQVHRVEGQKSSRYPAMGTFSLPA